MYFFVIVKGIFWEEKGGNCYLSVNFKYIEVRSDVFKIDLIWNLGEKWM